MYRLKSLNENSEKIFIQREWLSLLIVAFLVTIGNRTASSWMLLLAAVILAFCIMKADISTAFCWSLFLIPNIRMLYGTGISFIVNALMALPLIVYFLRMGARRISAVALLGSFALFMIELLHDLILCNLDNLVTITGWTLSFLLCILVTIDSRVDISKEDVFSALSIGIIASAIMYLGAGLESISHIIEELNYGARFTAFADDPNYYSLYICLAIACVLNVKGKAAYKLCSMFVMMGIGLLTASKMCMLVMAFELILIILQIFNGRQADKGNRKFIFALVSGVACLLIILKDYIVIFVDNIVRRMGQTGNGLDLNALTTGRSEIFAEYIDILFNNISCFLFGYGFNYHLFLGQTASKGAHNTYLDFLLAWGIIGTTILVGIIMCWWNSCRKNRMINKTKFIQKLPVYVLLINWIALSCLSASMFPFIIAVVMIQCFPQREIKNERE